MRRCSERVEAIWELIEVYADHHRTIATGDTKEERREAWVDEGRVGTELRRLLTDLCDERAESEEPCSTT